MCLLRLPRSDGTLHKDRFVGQVGCADSKLSITHGKELVTTSESPCMKILSTSVNTSPKFIIIHEKHQRKYEGQVIFTGYISQT